MAAYAEGIEILTENGILVITGEIGSGKTTAIQRIISLLNEDQDQWKVEDISFWKKNQSHKDKVLIKWDDCFGKFVANPVRKKCTKEKIVEIVEWVNKGIEKRGLILTMKESEFSSFCVNDLLEKKCNLKVCLDNMSDDVRSNLMDCYSIEVESRIEMTSAGLGSLGFPLICKLAKIPYIAKNFKSFSKDPFSCAMRLFDDLKSNNKNLYCALVYILFKGGNTDVRSIDSVLYRQIRHVIPPVKNEDLSQNNIKNEKSEDLDRSLNNELGTIFNENPQYFQAKNEGCFELHHHILLLWHLCHFYKRYPKMFLEKLDFDLLLDLLRPDDHEVESYELDIVNLCSNQAEKTPDEHSEDISELPNDGGSIKSKEKSETQSWIFILGENMYDCFLDRFQKDSQKAGKHMAQIHLEDVNKLLYNHPLLENKNFQVKLKSKIKLLDAVCSAQSDADLNSPVDLSKES